MLLFGIIIVVFLISKACGVRSLEAAVHGLAAALFCSAWDHILRCAWYVSVMAPWLPYREAMVYASAAARMAFSVMLLFHTTRKAALISTLVLMMIVLQVNLRIALGADLEAVRDMTPAWRWLRLSLHLAWIAWIVGCLVGWIRHDPDGLPEEPYNPDGLPEEPHDPDGLPEEPHDP